MADPLDPAELARLSPKMQEAVKFVSYWQLATSTIDFVMAMDWPMEKKSLVKAAIMATKFRKNGVPLKLLRERAIDYDYSYLKIVGQRALAELGREKAAAQVIFDEVKKLYEESGRMLLEMRKYRHRVIVTEQMIAEGELTV